jgi:MYXO-CTERM domain-containing protein
VPLHRPRATLPPVRKTILAVAAASAALAFTVPALANGRFPAANQLVFAPNDPNYIVLRGTYAILPSKDNGASWQYICEDVLGLPSDQGEDPSIAVTANTSLLAGVPGFVGGGLGLSVSADHGCNWTCMGGGLAQQSVIDLAVRPDVPSSVVAITGSYLPSDSGTLLLYNQVFQTTDNAVTWNTLGTPIDPDISVATIDVTKTDPNRIYVSGTRGYGSMRVALLLVSRDMGNTWVERPIPQFDANVELSIYIAAIDPTNADRVYLRSSGQLTGGVSRIYFTTDAGTDFSLASTLPSDGGFFTPAAGTYDLTGELLGFALSPDGSKVYAGTIESGLWTANASDMVFTQKNADVRVHCLATRNDELWACSDIQSGFTLGESTDDGATFTTKMKYVTSICSAVECAASDAGPLGCGATANAAACGQVYQNFCENTDVSSSCGTCAADAGAPDGGGPAKAPAPSSSCGCSVVGGGGATGLLGAGLALVALAAQRRRSKRPR